MKSDTNLKKLFYLCSVLLKPKTDMKKLNFLLLAGAVALIAACGPSAEELKEKARLDSIRVADSMAKVQAIADSIAQAEAAAAAEQARLDSIAQAEEAAKGKKK